MKFKRGDKVALVCVKNVYGVDFQCFFGELLGVRTLYGKSIYKIKAARLLLIHGETDMEGKEMEVSAQVFTLLPFTPDVKVQLRAVRAACQGLQKEVFTLLKFKSGS